MDDILEDVQRIWDNCMLYNSDNSQLYKDAVKLSKFSKKFN